MGWERTAVVRVGRERSTCHVHLESDGLVIRGPIRRQVARAAMTSLATADGWLTFAVGDEAIDVELGDDATSWRDRLRSPRTRCQKLGLKPGLTVCVRGEVEADFPPEVEAETGVVVSGRMVAGADLVLLFCEAASGLGELARLVPKLAPNGAIWVFFPKGRKDVTHDVVVAAGRECGLSLSKSMAFSARLTGVRLSPARAPKKGTR